MGYKTPFGVYHQSHQQSIGAATIDTEHLAAQSTVALSRLMQRGKSLSGKTL